MRKISVSADRLNEITSPKAVNSLKEGKRLNVSEDNIHFVSLASSKYAHVPFHERNKFRFSMEYLDTIRAPSPKRKQPNEIVTKRRLQAKQKQEERQTLINNLNKDIKRANKYLRNLRTRSMPLLEELNINFEIPYDFIQALLKSKKQEGFERKRSATIDLIV